MCDRIEWIPTGTVADQRDEEKMENILDDMGDVMPALTRIYERLLFEESMFIDSLDDRDSPVDRIEAKRDAYRCRHASENVLLAIESLKPGATKKIRGAILMHQQRIKEMTEQKLIDRMMAI